MTALPKLSRSVAQLLAPSGGDAASGLRRTTHLAVGAHPDDLEIMAWHGIAGCYGRDDAGFAGVVVTTGSASPGVRPSERDALVATRLDEQLRAAERGRYVALAYLGYESDDIKRSTAPELARDLDALLHAARPRIVYTHSPFDTHATHVAVASHLVAALRRLPAALRPEAVYGCEVWGALGWLPEPYMVRLDVSDATELGPELIALHASQVAGGKRYDLATLGRKRANATFADARDLDRASAVELAVNLTPLLEDGAPSLPDFVDAVLREHADAVKARLAAVTEVPWKS